MSIQSTDNSKAFLPGLNPVTPSSKVTPWDYPYPTSPTIKGLQVRMVDDAIKLGVGHAAINLNIGNILRPAKTDQTITFIIDGREFYFDGAYLTGFDKQVKELSDRGIVVNLILLNSPVWDGIEIHPDLRSVLLHPDYDPEGRISAFNVVTEEGLAYYKAFIGFVAERYTRPDAQYGRACGYIIGNEVDTQWVWCNAGEKTVDGYVREYAVAMRTAFDTARRKYRQARVYISLTHLWNMTHEDNPMRYYRGREVIEKLNEISTRDGNYDWSVAYHPYPENLFQGKFWEDKTAIDSFDTPRITFKNIEILPRYFSQPHLLYDGRLRHIILSEQGFHSDESEESERIQAAAYAFAYWKIAQIHGIESFILHAHVDHRDEFDLNLGLWRRDKASPIPNAPGSPKPIYFVFRDIDGPNQQDVFQKAREVIGEEHWKSIP